MPNQYLYLSSKNSENHADFNWDLPNGLRIMPYSQLRVLSCRLNVDPNVLSIPPRRPASEPTSLTAHSVLLMALYNGTIKRRGKHGVRR